MNDLWGTATQELLTWISDFCCGAWLLIGLFAFITLVYDVVRGLRWLNDWIDP